MQRSKQYAIFLNFERYACKQIKEYIIDTTNIDFDLLILHLVKIMRLF